MRLAGLFRSSMYISECKVCAGQYGHLVRVEALYRKVGVLAAFYQRAPLMDCESCLAVCSA